MASESPEEAAGSPEAPNNVAGIPEVIEGHLAVARLEPGDVIVFTCQEKMCEEAKRTAHRGLQRIFPGHKTLVVDSGTQLAVIRSSPEADD